MELFFWQNIISPHQVDLLDSLSKKYKVTLIVDKKIDKLRSQQSWSIEVPKDIKLIVSPSHSVIRKILKSKDGTHIVSGLLAYKLSNLVLLYSKFYGIKLFIISESVCYDSFKGLMKLNLRRILSYPFKKNITGIFVTGQRAKEYFLKLGFTNHLLFDFGYFVNITPSIKNSENVRKVKKLIFVGRLIKLKGIAELLNAFSLLLERGHNLELKIIGTGPLRTSLINSSNALHIPENKLSFIDDIPRANVLHEIEKSDLLILPNISEEGWGVVVNESLLLGTPVLCSKFTGANVIINKEFQGHVLDEVDVNHIVNGIEKINCYDRTKIQKCSFNRISPDIISQHFINCLIRSDNSLSPWINL